MERTTTLTQELTNPSRKGDEEEIIDEKQPEPPADHWASRLMSKLTAKKPKMKKPNVNVKQKAIGFITLFRFATAKDRVLILIALFCSICVGAIQPVSTIILGQFLQNFTSLLLGPPGTDILSPVIPVILVFVYLGTANLVLGYVCQCFWVLSGELQTRRIRKMYVHSILRQDMSWFDQATDGSLTTRLAADTNIIQDGISEKFGLLVQCCSQFLSGVIIAFVRGPRLAVVLLAALPFMGG